MKSCVVGGRFKGKRLLLRGEIPGIALGRGQWLPLNSANVERMAVLYIHWRPGAASGWARGLTGSLLGRTMQLSAIRSARRIPTFHCRVHFHDGSISLLRMNEPLFLALSAGVSNSPGGNLYETP